jgi:hypothetical protein
MNQKALRIKWLALAHQACFTPFPVGRLKRGGEFYRPQRGSQHLRVKKFQNDEIRLAVTQKQQQAPRRLLLQNRTYVRSAIHSK